MKATATRIRWRVMFLVFLIVTISYLDRTNLSVAAPTLQHQLHLTPTQLGLILSAFLLGLCGGADTGGAGGLLAQASPHLSVMRFGCGAFCWL